ncbi:translation initiation factor IF-2-like [Nycticebus coucang]|uniref:translation initiation factor IF-2-like n=1 Tax=Nycticebus coucang TaxID=9470 RepID=UPI00234DAA27|nr:translation initiation factor IF-2-like [Nycticebus coucang]
MTVSARSSNITFLSCKFRGRFSNLWIKGHKKTPPIPGGERGKGQSEPEVSSEAYAGKSDKWDGRFPSSTPPHRTPRQPGPGLPKAGAPQVPHRKTERKKGSGRAAVLEGRSYLEASGEESKDDLWFPGAGDRRGDRSGGGRRDQDVQGEVRAAAGTRGDGCPVRRPSGSAAVAPLGLTAGPESQRSGSGGLTILPRGPVPSNRHRPRCGSAGGSSLTFLAGGASARCSGPSGGGGGDVRGGGQGERKIGSAAAAGGGGRIRRRSRWSWSRRCQSRRSLPAKGPRQCPFLSPIVNITGRLSPWHTRNRTFWPAAPASGARPLETSNGKPGLIGRRLPSLPRQHVRLRADQGLAAGRRRNRRVEREETKDWAEA